MAIVLIPVTNDPDSLTTVKLEDVVYTFRLRWNARAGAWFMDILDGDDVVLVGGRKLVVEWPLTSFRDANPRLPPGLLWCRDTQGGFTDPTLEDLGVRVLLYYEESV